MKADSVRHQRPFAEHMATLHQGIDNLLYAAEIACHENKSEQPSFFSDNPKCVTCPFCHSAVFKDPSHCGIATYRHFLEVAIQAEQHDIPASGPCVPYEPTQPECGKCTGRDGE